MKKMSWSRDEFMKRYSQIKHGVVKTKDVAFKAHGKLVKYGKIARKGQDKLKVGMENFRRGFEEEWNRYE